MRRGALCPDGADDNLCCSKVHEIHNHSVSALEGHGSHELASIHLYAAMVKMSMQLGLLIGLGLGLGLGLAPVCRNGQDVYASLLIWL